MCVGSIQPFRIAIATVVAPTQCAKIRTGRWPVAENTCSIAAGMSYRAIS